MKLLQNAHFYVDGGFDNAVQALLIDQGRIIKLLEEPLPATADLERIDLQGAFVYPGFIDAHTHSYSGGLYADGVDLSGCASLDDVLALVSDTAAKAENFVFAWRFDEDGIREQRFPTRKELDSACPDKNLLLRRVDGHSCVLNSRSRNLVPGLSGQDDVLKGAENDLAVNWLQDNCDEETILKAYHAAARVGLKGGFSTLHTMIGDAQQSNQHYALIRDHLGDFPLRFEIYPQSFNIHSALELGSQRIGGCILADGSLGSHTAALSGYYSDSNTRGNLYQTDQFWLDFVTQAHRNKLQVCVHCIGDAAIRQVNNAYLKQDRGEVAELRHQLIHCEVTPDDLMEEIAASGAVPVMQPAFDLLWGGPDGLYEKRLGPQRSSQMNRFGSFARSGVRVCGSSDWYVTDLNIAMSLHALINHHNPDERLTPREAIKVYTENNAWLNHEENLRGRIAPGFVADLSVMNTDFTRAFDYTKSRALRIIRGGESVHAD